MSGVIKPETSPAGESGELIFSWKLDNLLQNAILVEDIPELPLGILQLDPPQEAIAKSAPPLMIESRSGTGKTLVLLQHAAFYGRRDDSRPGCFITVSPRLRDELHKKYEELRPVLFNGLPPTDFFSFRQILEALLKYKHVTDFTQLDICNFSGYCQSRKSYCPLPIEPQLIENEIGGVIMGSVGAALQKRPLSREEYLRDKRSNISTKFREGKERRELVYAEYERYSTWKHEIGRFDLNDMVLRLQKENFPQIFSSAYLDEVQDLSHASIHLICSIAGKESLHWVCAGDPAQMISPGCCFNFDGLKQTLRAVHPGIEKSKLKTVHHLLVNYRTTKDILELANEILAIAKREFPGAIEFALPEIAKKDLGLRVVMCSWCAALKTNVKFGENQVLIYSPGDSERIPQTANTWLNDHPFILSSLDSKGLEFDDVVIAFDMNRKSWDASRHEEVTLRMLRELYVAVTRAQRRVVILLKDGDSNMRQFFNDLNCEEVEAEVIFQEFDRETTSKQWFLRANMLLEGGQFRLAASCFTRAERHDWSFWAKGEDYLNAGLKDIACTCFRRAVRVFYECRQRERILDLLKKVIDISGVWDRSDDEIFDEALREHPDYLPRLYIVRLLLLQDNWNHIGLQDLTDPAVSSIFFGYRNNDHFKRVVRTLSEDDRLLVEDILPWAIGDFYLEIGNFQRAAIISLQNRDYELAARSTESMLESMREKVNKAEMLSLVALWTNHKLASLQLPHDSLVLLLMRLFDSPLSINTSTGRYCLKVFGKNTVRLAVENAGMDKTQLLVFGQKEFKKEVEDFLVDRFKLQVTAVVEWYADNGYESIGVEFARARDWSDDDILRIVLHLRHRPKWLFAKLFQRGILKAATAMVILSHRLGDANKEAFRLDYKQYDSESLSLPSDATLESSARRVSTTFELDLLQLTACNLHAVAILVSIHVDNAKLAGMGSVTALETHSQAAYNVAKLLRLWEESPGWKTVNPSTPQLRQRILTFFGDRQVWAVSHQHLDSCAAVVEKISTSLSADLEYGSLVKSFGPVAAAYCRIIHDRPHSEDVLHSLANFYSELRAVALSRLDALATPKERRAMKRNKTKEAKVVAATEQSFGRQGGPAAGFQGEKRNVSQQKQTGRKGKRNNKKGGKKKKNKK